MAVVFIFGPPLSVTDKERRYLQPAKQPRRSSTLLPYPPSNKVKVIPGSERWRQCLYQPRSADLLTFKLFPIKPYQSRCVDASFIPSSGGPLSSITWSFPGGAPTACSRKGMLPALVLHRVASATGEALHASRWRSQLANDKLSIIHSRATYAFLESPLSPGLDPCQLSASSPPPGSSAAYRMCIRFPAVIQKGLLPREESLYQSPRRRRRIVVGPRCLSAGWLVADRRPQSETDTRYQ